MMRKGAFSLLTLCALLQACGAGPRPTPAPPSVQRPSAHRPPAAPQPRPEARVMQLPGLEGVIGADAAALLRQFGPPRLDLFEGDVRKLQFSGPACVLDIYLYPPEGGGEPRATHVDARRASDGQDVDRAACIAALRQR